MTQKRENLLANEKYPSKKKGEPSGRNAPNAIKQANISTGGSNEKSRVSQSLLLDNFYSKSKERLVTQRNIDDLNKKKELQRRGDSVSVKSSELQ
jgi:DNA mismatch repair ATPase MutS